MILSKWEESEQAGKWTRTTRSEDLARVKIADLTRAQRNFVPSFPIDPLQLERLNIL